jgi:hypothetical protein
MKEGKFEIEKWSTRDKGKSWKITAITAKSRFNNVRPFVVEKSSKGDSVTVLWMNVQKYIHWTDFRTSIKMDVKK